MFLIEWRFCKRPSILTYDVTFLRHMTSKKIKKIEKKLFLQIVKVKGQTQGQGILKLKGQGHLEIFTILYVIDVIWLIYEKWKSASNIVNVQPILPKIDTHNAWTYLMECAKNWIDPKNVTYVSMATKIPIIKHREFLHISMCYISAIHEHIASIYLHQSCRGTNGEFSKSNDLEMSRSRSNISRTKKITF